MKNLKKYLPDSVFLALIIIAILIFGVMTLILGFKNTLLAFTIGVVSITISVVLAYVCGFLIRLFFETIEWFGNKMDKYDEWKNDEKI